MKPGWQTIIEDPRFEGLTRLLWDAKTLNGTIRAYSIAGCVAIVHDYADGDGWQVYTPTTDSGDIEETLTALDARARGIDYDYRSRK